MTIVATPASSRIASSIPTAAVGRKNGRPARPAVALSASAVADEDQADQEQRVVAVPELAPEPPDPAEQQPDDEDREEQPAAEPGDVGARVPETELRRSSRAA